MPGHGCCWLPAPADALRAMLGILVALSRGFGGDFGAAAPMAEPELGCGPRRELWSLCPQPGCLQSTGWFWGRLGTQPVARGPWMSPPFPLLGVPPLAPPVWLALNQCCRIS